MGLTVACIDVVPKKTICRSVVKNLDETTGSITKIWYLNRKLGEAMGKNTSISLGSHFERFIESTVSKGRYSSASEAVRAGLRLLEEEENRLIVLRNAIREGIESGRAVDFDANSHLELLRSRKKNG